MVLVETHCHTCEVSPCALVPASEIPQLYKDAGYGAIVVTDHYKPCVLVQLAPDRATQIDAWLAGYRLMKQAGEAIGMKILLGMELSLADAPEDYLVYGIDEDFLRSFPKLAECSLEQACGILRGHGMAVFQAHPFRNRLTRAPARLLHGVEAYNGNARHESRNGLAAAFAREHGLRAIAGSDFHQMEDLGRGGIRLPETALEGNLALADYLACHDAELYTTP